MEGVSVAGKQNNLEHEKMVLGIIKGNNDVLDENILRPELFYDKRNQRIYKKIIELISQGRTVDDISLYDEMKSEDGIGTYIASLSTGSAANLGYYVDSLRECHFRRQIGNIGRMMADTLDNATPEEAMELLEKELTKLTSEADGSMRILREVLSDMITETDEAYKSKGEFRGITSGYPGIDRKTNGFYNGDLIILGARPSIGKTSLAMGMAGKIAHKGICCGFFSCEMSAVSLCQRLIATEARIDLRVIRNGSFDENGMSVILDSAQKISGLPLYISDRSGLRLSALKTDARKMKRNGVRIIFIDYLTLISHGDSRMPRHERVGEISKQLKALARELNIPIVVLSQVGRDAEDRMPTLANLRQSGEIEEDADVIMFLHRSRDENETDLLIAKNRNGPTGIVKLIFLPQFVRFEERYEGG